MLRLRKRIMASCTFARSPTSSFDDLGDVTDNGAIAIQVCFEPVLYLLGGTVPLVVKLPIPFYLLGSLT